MLSTKNNFLFDSSVYKLTHHVTPASEESITSSSLESSTKSSIASSHKCPESLWRICDLIVPFIHPVAAESFTSRTGKLYELSSSSPRFTYSLGSKILILDVENRVLNETGGLLDKESPPTDELHGLTFGRLNHYVFGQYTHPQEGVEW